MIRVKSNLLPVGLMLASISAFSAGSAISAETELCSVLGGLAEEVMAARQRGVDASALVEKLSQPQFEVYYEFSLSLVIAAYDKPRYSTDKMIESEISDFKNLIYVQCLKS